MVEDITKTTLLKKRLCAINSLSSHHDLIHLKNQLRSKKMKLYARLLTHYDAFITTYYYDAEPASSSTSTPLHIDTTYKVPSSDVMEILHDLLKNASTMLELDEHSTYFDDVTSLDSLTLITLKSRND